MKKKILLMNVVAIFGLATITVAQTVPTYVPTTGLVGWWPFNGNANDESGNGNDGNVLNASLSFDRYGNEESSYSIDGINCPTAKGVNLPCNISNAGEYTISIWYFTNDSIKNTQAIFNSNPHQYIGSSYNYIGWGNVTNGHVGNGLWLNAGPTGTISWPSFGMNDWHQLIVVKSSSEFKFYGDGILKFNYSFSPSFNIGFINSIVAGAISINGGINCYETFSGNIDDIGIWNRALTELEIADLYNGCQISFNVNPNSQTVDINNNAQFVVGSSDPSATFQWQTDFGVGFQNLNSVGQYSGTTNDTLNVANVTLSNNNQPFRCIIYSGSCSDTSNVAVLTVNNSVGINEFTQDNLFSVYPNPAHSQINVKADANLLGSDYTAYDSNGRIVLSGKINSDNTVIELGNLSSGIYLFSVGENFKQTFKVIK